jgi:nucleoside-diphosphate-sugar epimerase
MKILLTGASGFLGSHIQLELSKKNELYTLSRFASNYNYNLAIDVPRFDEKFDLVIHSAGKAHSIPTSYIEKQNFFATNVSGTSNLLKALSQNILPQKFVFISSVSVYGLVEGVNIKETAPLLSNDPYGKSKIEAEEIVTKWCDEHNVICTILRLPLVVGEKPPGNLGTMIRGIKKGYYFNIGGGNSKKSMVLATDISQCILKAAEIGGTFNLTDGFHPTFYDLSKKIASQSGRSFVPNVPKIIAKIFAKFGDLFGDKFPINTLKYLKITSTLTFDDTKARMAFDWNPSPVLDSFKIQKDAK